MVLKDFPEVPAKAHVAVTATVSSVTVSFFIVYVDFEVSAPANISDLNLRKEPTGVKCFHPIKG